MHEKIVKNIQFVDLYGSPRRTLIVAALKEQCWWHGFSSNASVSCTCRSMAGNTLLCISIAWNVIVQLCDARLFMALSLTICAWVKIISINVYYLTAESQFLQNICDKLKPITCSERYEVSDVSIHLSKIIVTTYFVNDCEVGLARLLFE